MGSRSKMNNRRLRIARLELLTAVRILKITLQKPINVEHNTEFRATMCIDYVDCVMSVE
jgi:hypothetical protein